ncbi:SDR family oxidoreductase [Clostridium sp. AN503]|uniref:SDR family NAD(P)-dependent oxidoreductase n=1 Tax=Clostridium sp. AN503 TaxID=3160598 RepID=UPI003458BFA9
MRFEKKVVFVTGAGAGIGRAAAMRFCEEGAAVACNSVSSSAEKVVEQLTAQGKEAMFVQGDIASEADVERMVAAVIGKYGRIDILVNNAGIVIGGTLENTVPEDFKRTLDVNVVGTFLMSQHVVKHMKEAGGGVIVNTTSVAGKTGLVNRLAYSASKGAVESLSRAMARELCHDNIRVNCVCPGTVLTPSLEDRINQSEDPEKAMKEFCGRQPVGRLGKPSEIAEAILFAACDEAAFMTGSSVVIDGGMLI